MNITSKSRYALKIMMDLSLQWSTKPTAVVQRSDIAERQGVPLDYMDHILSRLREAGLVESVRGRGGGYRLVVPPGDVSVFEIFTAVEDAFEVVQCLDGATVCGAEDVCTSREAWGVISSAIRSSLSGIILEDLVQARGAGDPAPERIGLIPRECRAPKRRLGGMQ